MGMTITEALAEIKTLNKRLEKKRAFVLSFLCRQDAIRDPLAKDGGSPLVISAERQSISDLEARIVTLRREIQRANEFESASVGGMTKTIANWLVWRREVAPAQRTFLNSLRQNIENVRTQAKRQGSTVVPAGTAAAQPTDVIVNVDERTLAVEIESLEQTLGDLDGVLSLKNATVTLLAAV